MGQLNDLNAIAEASIAAHQLIDANGTPLMKMVMRTLLFEIGREFARQDAGREERTATNGSLEPRIDGVE